MLVDEVFEAIVNESGEGLSDEEFLDLMDMLLKQANTLGRHYQTVGEWIDECVDEIRENLEGEY